MPVAAATVCWLHTAFMPCRQPAVLPTANSPLPPPPLLTLLPTTPTTAPLNLHPPPPGIFAALAATLYYRARGVTPRYVPHEVYRPLDPQQLELQVHSGAGVCVWGGGSGCWGGGLQLMGGGGHEVGRVRGRIATAASMERGRHTHCNWKQVGGKGWGAWQQLHLAGALYVWGLAGREEGQKRGGGGASVGKSDLQLQTLRVEGQDRQLWPGGIAAFIHLIAAVAASTE